MDKVEDIVGLMERWKSETINQWGDEYEPRKDWEFDVSNAIMQWAKSSDEAADLIQSQQSLIEEMKGALETSHVALNDWLNVYASDMCDPARVREAQDRVGSGGTIAYVAHVTAKIREALSQKE